jgi:hypothetical protein
MALPAHSGSRPLIQFRNHFSQMVGLLGWGISPSQGRYLNTGQHRQNKRIHISNIHALSGIRTHDPSVRASEESSWLRSRGYCDRPDFPNGVPWSEVDEQWRRSVFLAQTIMNSKCIRYTVTWMKEILDPCKYVFLRVTQYPGPKFTRLLYITSCIS